MDACSQKTSDYNEGSCCIPEYDRSMRRKNNRPMRISSNHREDAAGWKEIVRRMSWILTLPVWRLR